MRSFLVSLFAPLLLVSGQTCEQRIELRDATGALGAEIVLQPGGSGILLDGDTLLILPAHSSERAFFADLNSYFSLSFDLTRCEHRESWAETTWDSRDLTFSCAPSADVQYDIPHEVADAIGHGGYLVEWTSTGRLRRSPYRSLFTASGKFVGFWFERAPSGRRLWLVEGGGVELAQIVRALNWRCGSNIRLDDRNRPQAREKSMAAEGRMNQAHTPALARN